MASAESHSGSPWDWGYSFFNGPTVECDEVTNDKIWHYYGKNDVSGSKEGVRCVGYDDKGGEPTVMEFNNKMGHFTAYANRDWAWSASTEAWRASVV